MRHVLIAVTLLLCSLPGQAAKRRAAASGNSSCVASVGGANCVLAFVSERDGNSEIYLIKLDGTSLVRLTANAGNNIDPTWSPDGKRIAFASDRGGDWDIFVMDADGSNVVRRTQTSEEVTFLRNGSSSAPAWSTDGKTIAFSSLRDGQLRIHVMSADGDSAAPTPVGYERGYNTQPAWSREDKRIAFVSDANYYDGIYDIHVMNADGSEIINLFAGQASPGLWTYYFQPSFSPDGGKIAVVVCEELWGECYPSSSIAIANTDGSGVKTLVRTSGLARPTWSPDASTIAFSWQACRTCAGELRYVSVDGSRSGVIFSNGHHPAWRP